MGLGVASRAIRATGSFRTSGRQLEARRSGSLHNWNVDPTVDFRVSSRVTGSVSYNVGRDVNATQFNGIYGDIGSTRRTTPSRGSIRRRSPLTVRARRDRDAESLAADLRRAVRDARQLLATGCRSRTRAPSSGRIAIRRSTVAIRARSTSSSIARTPSCAGNIVRARRCISSGRRSARESLDGNDAARRVEWARSASPPASGERVSRQRIVLDFVLAMAW